MSETTTEQLVEIEGQAEDTPASEYTPPDGWRLLAVGELVMLDDQWVRQDGSVWRSMGTEGPVLEGLRYIRRIEPEPVWVCEGRWRTRGGDIKNIRPCEPLKGAYYVWPWTDGFMTFQDNGRHQGSKESPNDLVEYLGPIEPDKTQEPETKTQDLPARTQDLPETGEESPDQLIGRISLLRRRVTQLEELVGSLRTINEAQEKAFEAAGQHNSDLQSRLNGVCSEWVQQAETIRRLQIELDAAQQVPADSPELRQLRADLAEVIRERDTYRHAHERVLSDLETIRATTKAEAVEAIVEWLVPIRAVDNEHLANETLQHLPQIMRHLTGLAQD